MGWIRRLLAVLFLAASVVLLTVVNGLLMAAERLDPEPPAEPYATDDDTLLRIREGLVKP